MFGAVRSLRARCIRFSNPFNHHSVSSKPLMKHESVRHFAFQPLYQIKWKDSGHKKALIVKKRECAYTAEVARDVAGFLNHEGIQPYVEELAFKDYESVDQVKSIATITPDNKNRNFPEVNSRPDLDGDFTGWQPAIDFVVCIGGDGTMLHASSLFAHACPPHFGINTGSLGFLLPFEPGKHRTYLGQMLRGELGVNHRARILCEFESAKKVTIDSRECHMMKRFRVLNETVLRRSAALTGVSQIRLSVNGVELCTFQGDGLIVSSPTGSSAYSMAAGGPVVDPALDCILLTPLNSMVLASRALVLPGNAHLVLEPLTGGCMIEGKFGREVKQNEKIHVFKSRSAVPTFTRLDASTDWLHDVKHRLGWESQVRNIDKIKRKQ